MNVQSKKGIAGLVAMLSSLIVSANASQQTGCTETQRKKYQVPGAMVVMQVRRPWAVHCKKYYAKFGGGSSGPINSTKASGQFFDYRHGRLYYFICSNFMDRKDVRSIMFVHWKTRSNKQIFRTQLLPVHNYCFLPGYFTIHGMKLRVTLTECTKGMWGPMKLKKSMTYQWHGNKHGCGTFRLVSKSRK